MGGTTTLSSALDACPAGSALTALPAACSPFATLGANAFSGNQTVSGTVAATAFTGNGAGLTGVSSSTATTASSALALGGNPPGFYATLGGNTFTAAQSMPSPTVSGAVQGSSVTATSSLTNGGTAIEEYVSVTDDVTLPPINPGECTSFEPAALTGFTPGTGDTIALGIPAKLLTGLSGHFGPGPGHAPNHGPSVFLTFQAFETSTAQSPTITLMVCNPSNNYPGGDAGPIRIDVFKH